MDASKNNVRGRDAFSSCGVCVNMCVRESKKSESNEAGKKVDVPSMSRSNRQSQCQFSNPDKRKHPNTCLVSRKQLI